MCDAIIQKTHIGYILDTHSSITPQILDHLTKYKMRNTVVFDQSDLKAIQLIQHPNLTPDIVNDPRTKLLGHRFYTSTPLTQLKSNQESFEEYTKTRIHLGIPEFPSSVIDNALPLEHNLDYLNAIDFRKGCYLGQELTVRTHHTGIVRKRVLKIAFKEEKIGYSLDQRSILENGKKVGTLYESFGKFGLAHLKLNCLGKELQLENGDLLHASLPFYLENLKIDE